uniref:NADH:flavin oxidoreductase/NADH oxidase N-terminal domain-containing protein n=1 Tax=Timspurckia oligopyrenoides TaxID=708627 RepID=A0A7S1ERE4_9RHOD|mmetsp:Transcript_1730/g.3070  ORF Transcript_1730/g.3070 Transcript_1730/m.3070 type:complete len:379 (+) Transcript_1730:151-1287(+)|eukprot:CAMPEP_0182442240 /NCGR_PEP_ID=MMETSP1172-20130603/1176_1 /TAXON_ID=708627 /ORGANISM="Timspurckia oligopyrenoides, Strain CCMP3278" /LENGTH=378 /DNA_ID=CAMNT_0024636993 /DNA_START=102 /DNA_END=1238 /DNA_ORIENTATION=+
MGSVETVKDLSTPVKVGEIGELKNRVVMAAMTRARCDNPELVPNDLMKEYYVQRKSAGMILTEGTHPSVAGCGWVDVPGIYTEAQVEGWKKINDAVHADNGARMVLQIWHQGRQSHEEVRPGKVLSASAVQAKGNAHARSGTYPYPVPTEMTLDDIKQTIEDHRIAAKNAKAAGFAGVEIHSANGYLLDCFLQSRTNKREDDYGGSIENRLKLQKEIIEAILTEWPSTKVGIKFSPNGIFGDMGSPEYGELFTAAIKNAAEYKLAFIEVTDGLAFGFHELGPAFTLEEARNAIETVQGPNPSTLLIGNCGYTRELANERIGADVADLVSFGRPFLSNPDLADRLIQDKPLEDPLDHTYFFTFGMGEAGYTKIPAKSSS